MYVHCTIYICMHKQDLGSILILCAFYVAVEYLKNVENLGIICAKKTNQNRNIIQQSAPI